MAIRGTSITPTGVQLTERQSQVLALVRRHIDDTGYPPTRADIARELGFKSANAAEEHLKALARKGVIEMIPGTSRGIRLVLDAADEGLPLVGASLRVIRFWRRRTSRTVLISQQAFFDHALIISCGYEATV